MPLKCLRAGEPVFAFDCPADEWEQLKVENRTLKHLAMACCGAGATPKTSKLGTRFFAHTQADGCSVPIETAEHILAKAAVAEAVKLAGWEVDTEVAGCTPAGEQWVADVMAIKGHARVAIEVQWSRQDKEETKRRQDRYTQSGVRGLWLLRHPNLLMEKATPTFRLRYEEAARRFWAAIPIPGFHPSFIGNHNKNESGFWQQEIDLTAFIAGTLSGALKFAPAIGRRMPVSICTAPVQCWRCKQITQTVIDIVFKAGEVLPGHPDIRTDVYSFGEIYECEDFLETVFAPDLLRRHKIGAIKRRHSRTAKGEYLSNGCFKCDALQGRFFDHDSWREATTAYTVEAELSDDWACQLLKSYDGIMRWWFDESVVGEAGRELVAAR